MQGRSVILTFRDLWNNFSGQHLPPRAETSLHCKLFICLTQRSFFCGNSEATGHQIMSRSYLGEG